MAKVLVSSVLLSCILSFARARSDVTCFRSDPVSGKEKRIYTIAHGHGWGAYEYVNKGGTVDGFTLDLIREVCSAAGMDCRTVWEPYQNCMVSAAGQHTRGGQGLMNMWYDGCAGWLVTTARLSIFSFSESYLKPKQSSFYTKPGDNIFDPTKFKDFKIGFGDGWAYDEKCLYRQYSQLLPENNIIRYKTTSDLLDALVQGKVAAVYVGDDVFEQYATGSNARVKRVGESKHCSVRGNAMMSNKDSSDFLVRWNEGFQKIVSSGAFKKLCDEASATHNADTRGVIDCI